jgi:autotransporter-associated beta strand protein
MNQHTSLARLAIRMMVALIGLLPLPAFAQTTITTSTTINTIVSYPSGLIVGGATPGPTLTIDPGAGITASRSGNSPFVVGSDANPFATVIQNGGLVEVGVNAGNNGQLYLGQNLANSNTSYSGSASYTLNSGTITLGSTLIPQGILGIGRSSNASFTQNGGLITARRNDQLFFIGAAGDGSYSITSGTFEGIGSSGASAGGLGIASSGFSTSGTLTVNGAGATVAVQPSGANLTRGGGSATVNLLNGTLALNGQVTRGVANSGTTPGAVSFTLGGGTLRPYDANLVVGSSTAANTAAFDITLAANTLSTITGVGWKGGESRSVTVVSNIVGSGSLQISGGMVTLSGSNSFTGNTTVNSGTLLLSNSNALRGSTFTGGAGTLAFGGTQTEGGNNYFYVGGVSGSSALSLTGTNGTAVRLNFGLNNADTTFSGNVTGTSSVSQFAEKAGTGTTTISGTWTLGGAGLTGGGMTVIQGGIRQIGGVVEIRRFDGSVAFGVGSGAGNSGSYVLESGTLMAVSALTSNLRIGQGQSTGTLTIDGASARAWFSGTNNTIGGNDIAINSGTGTLNLRAGELAVNSLTTGAVAGSQGTFNFSGGTLRPYSQDTTIGGVTGFTIALAGTSATLSGIDAAAGTARTLTILTTLVDGTAGAGGLNVAGGMVVLPRTNSFTGNTTVSSGTLSIGNGSTTGSIPGNVANNGTLVFNRSNAITYSGAISGSGDVLQQGAGTLTLSGSNSFTGNTTVNSGTLLLSNSNALRGSTFTGGAGTLAFGGTGTGDTNYFYVGGLSGSSALSLTSTNGTAVRLNFGLNNANTTFSGNVTGTAVGQFVEKVGTGTTTISGNWTSGSQGLTGGGVTVLQGGIRQVGGVVTANRNEGSSAVGVGFGSGTTGSYVLESGTLNAITGPLANLRIGFGGGTGILTIDGVAATARFSGTNNTIGGNDIAAQSGTGTLNLRAGELAVNSLTTGTVAGSQGTFNFSGGTLRPYSQDTSIGRSGSGFTIALSGNAPTLSGLDAAAGTARNLTILTSLVNASGTTGGINVSGGTVSLAAANTYSGATTIAGVNTRLVLAANGSFANSATITVGNPGSSGAILDLSAKTGMFTFGTGQTVGGIGTIKMDAINTARFAGTFAPGNSPGILTFDGGTGLLSGTTQIEIFGSVRGTGYDAVDLINSAALNYDNGVLALDFGSWLADQQSYQLFGSGSSSLLGSFSSVTIAGTNYTGLTFSGSNGVWTSQGTSSANQTLTFTEATGTLVIVPEPGAIALAGIGIAAAAWGYRRRRS